MPKTGNFRSQKAPLPMYSKLLTLLLALMLGTQIAVAQSDEAVWVQIKARPSLAEATADARLYSQSLQDVNGFSLGSGWYAIALGPYDREGADQALRNFRARNLIPNDSYITFSSAFQSQFWPIGANILTGGAAPVVAPTVNDSTQTAAIVETTETPAVPVVPQFKDAGETEDEAFASERLLNREQKKDLQRLLQWAGFYKSAIDGAYGRGTRAAMAAWQEANGYEPNGVMSTLQRTEILRAYNAVLDGMDLRRVTNWQAGIDVQIPLGVVEKTPAIYPFVSYEPKGDIAAQVLLISQEGDRTTLNGLYEVLQTLTIVPFEGPRKLSRSGFSIEGRNDEIISYTEVGLRDGQIKGFSLVWPAGDEERRRRILTEMQASFTRTEGVLRPEDGADLIDSIDMLAGLDVRRPKFSRSGFFTDRAGTVITTTEAIGSCERVTLNEQYEAELVGQEDTLGVAVLRPKEAIAPMSVATFRESTPRRRSEIAVAGFSFEGLLGAPTMTYGTVQELKGLRGESDLSRLALAALPGDAGGPVFDISGSVVGMLRARPATGATQLPNNVSLTADAQAIQALLTASGLTAASADQAGALDPVDLTEYASEMTVLVSCW